MPILTPEAPRQSIDALSAMLSTLALSAGLKQAAPHFAARIAASPHEIRTPGLSYRIYVLGLADIVSGAGLANAKLSAWRHEFTNDGEVVSADVTTGRQPRFSALNLNPKVNSIQSELQSAVFAAANFRGGSYEAVLLQVSALAVRALWLRARSRSREDVIVPLAPVRSELTAHRSYTPAEFIAALTPAASSVLAAEDPRKGG